MFKHGQWVRVRETGETVVFDRYLDPARARVFHDDGSALVLEAAQLEELPEDFSANPA
jgi:hypothetical protein